MKQLPLEFLVSLEPSVSMAISGMSGPLSVVNIFFDVLHNYYLVLLHVFVLFILNSNSHLRYPIVSHPTWVLIYSFG